MKRFTDLDALVDDLLSRHEARPGSSRLLAYVGDFPSISLEDAFLVRLRSLELDGAISVKRQRKDGVTGIARIALMDMPKLYSFRKRTPSSATAFSALSSVRAMEGLPATAGPVIDAIENAWSRNVSWSGLRPGDSEGLVASMQLAVALNRLASEQETFVSVDYRTSSRRHASDSKVLERRLRLVVQIYDKLFPTARSTPDADDVDFLAGTGVERFPQPLLVGGTIALDGMTLQATPFVGIPAEQVSRISVNRASYVLMIESYSSFVRHCREINGDGRALVIYTGGFPSRALMGAITTLVPRLLCPTFHWGDIDRGGLSIFMNLERVLSRHGVVLWPHLMDIDTLVLHGSRVDTKLPALPPGGEASAVAGLWRHLAGMDDPLGLEQEELDPMMPTSTHQSRTPLKA